MRDYNCGGGEGVWHLLSGLYRREQGRRPSGVGWREEVKKCIPSSSSGVLMSGWTDVIYIRPSFLSHLFSTPISGQKSIFVLRVLSLPFCPLRFRPKVRKFFPPRPAPSASPGRFRECRAPPHTRRRRGTHFGGVFDIAPGRVLQKLRVDVTSD